MNRPAPLKHLTLRAIAALLVLVAATFAVLPSGVQAEAQSGSAFSAATVEVAVGCARQQVETRALPDRPAPPPPGCAPVQAASTAEHMSSTGRPGSHARAPPLPEPALKPVNPRAPPAA